MEAEKSIKDILEKNFRYFDRTLKNFINDFKKNIQELDFGKKDIFIDINKNQNSGNNHSYYKEIEKMKKQLELSQKINQMEKNIRASIADSINQETALKLLQTYQDAQPVAEKLTGTTKELSTLFSNAIEKMIDGTENFGDVMKKLLNDLKNYFIKAMSDAIIKGVISSAAGGQAQNLLRGFSSRSALTGVNFIFDTVKSLFGSHHSGGYIENGTGNFSVPGTAEYLTVLKGGERVLSPAENKSFNSEISNSGKNIVVNNFNVQAWDSKDVQQYLLENKNILAGITVENIKYNNSNLRYTISGI